MHSNARRARAERRAHCLPVAAGDDRQFKFDPHVGIRSGRIGWFGAEELPAGIPDQRLPLAVV